MRKIILLTIFFTVFTFFQLKASWIPQMDYTRVSENGLYKVKVTVPEKDLNLPSEILTFKKNGDDWDRSWDVLAINKEEPMRAQISNDGKYVVTVGNWYGRDKGNDEVVVYREGKMLNHYSLVQLLGGHYRPKVWSSGGSEWLINSIQFFYEDKQFCIWLDFRRKWVVVNLEDGNLVKPSVKDQFKYRERARKLCFEKIKRGRGYIEPYYHIIARFLKPEDRPMFEDMLKRPFQSIRCQRGMDRNFHYWYYNRYRELAEMALDALDKKKNDAIIDFKRNKDYKRLGSLEMLATFDNAPKKGEGVIMIWLEPITDAKNNSEKNKRPDHAMGIELEWQFPFDKKKKEESLDMPVIIVMYGVTPGKYKIRGAWIKDKKMIHQVYECWNSKERITITPSPTVDIRAGKITEGVKISFKDSGVDKVETETKEKVSE